MVIAGWTVQGSNPSGGVRFSTPVQTSPIHWVIPGDKAARDVTLTFYPNQTPRLKKENSTPPLFIHGRL